MNTYVVYFSQVNHRGQKLRRAYPVDVVANDAAEAANAVRNWIPDAYDIEAFRAKLGAVA